MTTYLVLLRATTVAVLLVLPGWLSAQQQPMLRAQAPEIVDAQGKPVLLRGCNVGGWLLQESYIINTDTLNSQGQIKRGLLRSLPEAEMERFYEQYRASFVTKKDIDFIAAQGFNCVRLPFHYDLFLTADQRRARTRALCDPRQLDAYVQALSTWYDDNQLFTGGEKLDGIRLIDQVLGWCAANKMYVILDLHAAPGGQGTDPNPNQINLIANLVAFRDRWQVPVWVGETGENSNEWFAAARQGLEAQRIGWCHWNLKRVDGRTSLLNAQPYGSILTPEGRAAALRNVAFDRCAPNKDVLAALTQPVTARAPFASLQIPGNIPLVDYDLGRAGHAYQDTYAARTDHRKTAPTNEGGKYRNDGVDVVSSTDDGTHGFAVGHLAAGEWLNYTVTVAKAGPYTVRLRAANGTPTAGKLLLKLDEKPIGSVVVPSTSGGAWQTFTSITPAVPAGKHTVQLYVEQPAAAVGWLQFEPLPKAATRLK